MARRGLTRAEGRKDVRHEINLVFVKEEGMVRAQAVCICGSFTSPLFWARERAEAAGEDHLLGLRKKGA